MAITKDIKTAKSVQEMQNLGFDTEFNLPSVEALVYNPVTDAMNRMNQPTTPTDNQLVELIPLFRALLLAIANPSYVDKSANAIRNQVQSGTITTVTTVTTVTNLTNFGSMAADVTFRLQTINNWATGVRSLIT